MEFSSINVLPKVAQSLMDAILGASEVKQTEGPGFSGLLSALLGETAADGAATADDGDVLVEDGDGAMVEAAASDVADTEAVPTTVDVAPTTVDVVSTTVDAAPTTVDGVPTMVDGVPEGAPTDVSTEVLEVLAEGESVDTSAESPAPPAVLAQSLLVGQVVSSQGDAKLSATEPAVTVNEKGAGLGERVAVLPTPTTPPEVSGALASLVKQPAALIGQSAPNVIVAGSKPISSTKIETVSNDTFVAQAAGQITELAGDEAEVAKPVMQEVLKRASPAQQQPVSGRGAFEITGLNLERLSAHELSPDAVRPNQPVVTSDGNMGAVRSTAVTESNGVIVERATIESVSDVVVKHVRVLARSDGERVIQVRLVPTRLGEMRIAVQSAESVVRIQLASQTQEVRDVLQSHATFLREHLGKEGIVVETVSVMPHLGADTNGPNSAGREPPSFNPGRSQPQGRQSGNYEGNNHGSSQQRRAPSGNASALDVWV